MWIAPTAPAAGPDSAVRIGMWRARATDISPPDDWLMPSAAFGAASRDAFGEVAEIAVDDRLEIGVQHGGREPLVFAEFRLHLGRDRQIHVGIGGAQRVADHRLVRGIEEREQEAHRAGVGLRVADRFTSARQRVARSSARMRLAVRRDALGRLEAQFARHQRRRIVVLQAEHCRADLPPDLDQVAEAFGDDQRDLAAAPLDQRVGGDRGAVREPRDRRKIDAVTAQARAGPRSRPRPDCPAWTAPCAGRCGRRRRRTRKNP